MFTRKLINMLQTVDKQVSYYFYAFQAVGLEIKDPVSMFIILLHVYVFLVAYKYVMPVPERKLLPIHQARYFSIKVKFIGMCQFV